MGHVWIKTATYPRDIQSRSDLIIWSCSECKIKLSSDVKPSVDELVQVYKEGFEFYLRYSCEEILCQKILSE